MTTTKKLCRTRPLAGRSNAGDTEPCAANGCKQRVPRSEVLHHRMTPDDVDGGSIKSIYLCEGCRVGIFNEMYNERHPTDSGTETGYSGGDTIRLAEIKENHDHDDLSVMDLPSGKTLTCGECVSPVIDTVDVDTLCPD